MAAAPAKDRVRHGYWIVGSAVLTLALAIAIGEASGWPFLIGPLQDWLSETLHRRISITSNGPGSGPVRIRLIGQVRMQADRVEIGAPGWSKAPHMVVANNAEVTLRYRDLWAAYRGGPLRIQRLHADQLDAQIERLADGRASWQFDDPKARDPARVARPLSLGELQITNDKGVGQGCGARSEPGCALFFDRAVLGREAICPRVAAT